MDEFLQRHLKRMQKIAEELGEPIGFTYRERGIIDPSTGEKWLLKTFPFMQQWVFVLRGEIKTIEIPTTCFILTRYTGPY